MPALILNSVGLPEPSPEIQRRLRQVHHGLGLKFSKAASHVWMVTMEWEREDPRWEMVKRQEMNPADAWDVIGFLPLDCSPDQAPGYLVSILRTYPKESISRLSERMHHYNDSLKVAHVEEAMHDVMQGNPSEFSSTKVTGKRQRHAIPKTV